VLEAQIFNFQCVKHAIKLFKCWLVVSFDNCRYSLVGKIAVMT